MKIYRCDATIRVTVAVEAASLAEAERIIDGICENASSVHVIEGDVDDPDDELVCSPAGISRSRIMSEN